MYWCSRLQQERDRLLKMIKPGQFLADIFCGVGPRTFGSLSIEKQERWQAKHFTAATN